MTPNQRIFESIYKMSEMAQAKADNLRLYIDEHPDLIDVYKDPSHIKPGTPANEKWKSYIADYYSVFPDDLEAGEKKPGKSFSDTIFPIVKRMDKAANAGKSDKTISVESIMKDLSSIQAKMEAAGLGSTGAYTAIEDAIESLSVVLDDSETQDIESMVNEA